MLADVHITTCHHSTVKCRDRQHLPIWNNITSWNSDERLEISKISVESIKNFLLSSGNKVRFNILDDGSDFAPALTWLKSLEYPNVILNEKNCSSAMINKYAKTIDADLVIHIEDDHICFNPKKLDFIKICHAILNSQEAKAAKIGVISFRSGLPSNFDSLGLYGAWGPQGFISIGKYNGIIYNSLGNSHHVMLRNTYLKFLPLIGNSGACEAYMNQKMSELGIKNMELQEEIYCFHSHKLNFPITDSTPSTDEWNRSGDGYEYGILDMHNWLNNKKRIICTKYLQYPNIKNRELLEGNYFYGNNN